MKIVLTGGGTGGHIYPALNVAEAFREKRPDAKLLFIGSSHGPEGALAKRAGLDFVGIPSGPLGKAVSLKNLSSLMKLILGVGRAYRLLRKFKPDVVISTGGYTSAGVVLAQKMRRGKVIIHEQNAVPGRTNLSLSKFADQVCVTFEESASYFPAGKTVYTGMPMGRKAIAGLDKAEARKQLDLDQSAFTVLVTGGSQGARKINDTILESLPMLEQVQVFHQVGDRNFEDHLTRVRKSLGWYRPVPYLHDIYRAYYAADLVVSRAGAATIADFTTAGCPAILVPYKFAYADHQKANAECVVKKGAAIIIDENDLTAQRLAGLIMELKLSGDRLQEMASASKEFAGPDAAEDIVKIANKLAGAGQEA